jgi:hypothetical protein
LRGGSGWSWPVVISPHHHPELVSGSRATVACKRDINLTAPKFNIVNRI